MSEAICGDGPAPDVASLIRALRPSNTRPHSRDWFSPEFFNQPALFKPEGAGNTGCWPHPRALRAKKVCILRTQATTGQPKQPAFPAQWFYGLYVFSSVSGLV